MAKKIELTLQDLVRPLNINTYRELSDRVPGLSPERAHQIWNRKTRIGFKKAKAIAQALNFSVGLLMSLDRDGNGR